MFHKLGLTKESSRPFTTCECVYVRVKLTVSHGLIRIYCLWTIKLKETAPRSDTLGDTDRVNAGAKDNFMETLQIFHGIF